MSELPFRLIFVLFSILSFFACCCYIQIWCPLEIIANSEFLPKFLPYLYISFGIGCMSFNDKFLWSSVISFGIFFFDVSYYFLHGRVQKMTWFFFEKKIVSKCEFNILLKIDQSIFRIVKLPFSKKIFRLNCTC